MWCWLSRDKLLSEVSDLVKGFAIEVECNSSFETKDWAGYIQHTSRYYLISSKFWLVIKSKRKQQGGEGVQDDLGYAQVQGYSH